LRDTTLMRGRDARERKRGKTRRARVWFRECFPL